VRQTTYFPLKGGINLVDPPLTLQPGELLGSSNYEHYQGGGYRRIDGYERYDGRQSPSAASYWIVDYGTGAIAEPSVNANVLGATSGATGKVGLIVVTSGTWAGGTAAGYLVLFNVAGSFIDTEALGFTAANDGFNSGFSAGFS